MRLLLDTHVLLWLLAGDDRAGSRAVAALEEARETRVSAVSYAEMAVKQAIGKLRLPVDLVERVTALGVSTLALRADHGLAIADLPLHHHDPFDRLLVAQAQIEGLTLVSADRALAAYDVELIDPTS